MSYRIVIEREVQRTLPKLDATVERRIRAAIDRLAENPYPTGARAPQGRKGVLRIRVGDYRILYEVADDIVILVVYVIRIAHRRESYRRL